MNIFMKELRFHRRSIIIWCVCMALFMVVGMQKYTSMAGSGSADVAKIMDDMPEFLKIVFGVSDFDVSTPGGYYGFIYTYVLIICFIHAVMLGSGIISREERDKTVEFLMPKPVSRHKILNAKMAAACVQVVLLWAVTWASSEYTMRAFGDASLGTPMAKLMAGLLLTQLLLMAVGAALAAVCRNPKRPAGLGTAVILGTYFLAVIVSISKQLRFLEFLTPFRYFSAERIILHDEFSVVYTVVCVTLTAGFLGCAYMAYRKRDLHI